MHDGVLVTGCLRIELRVLTVACVLNQRETKGAEEEDKEKGKTMQLTETSVLHLDPNNIHTRAHIYTSP